MTKSVSIKPSDILPTYVNGEYRYTLRYRIISDNKNRFSEWSPFYDIGISQLTLSTSEQTITPLQSILGTTSITATPLSTNIGTQSLLQIYLDFKSGSEQVAIDSDQQFDLFVRRYNTSWSEWEYAGTQSYGPISYIVDNTFSQVEISVHVPSYPKTPPINPNTLDLDTTIQVARELFSI